MQFKFKFYKMLRDNSIYIYTIFLLITLIFTAALNFESEG